jgi:TPR repeat protein
MSAVNLIYRCNRRALATASLLIVVGVTIELAPLAVANSSNSPTAGAPQQLVHAFPLGPQRLCCSGGQRAGTTTTGRPAPGHAPAAGQRPGAAPASGSSNAIMIAVVGTVLVLLLLAGGLAAYGARRRRVAAALTSGIGAALGVAPELAKPAPNGTNGLAHRVWVGHLSPFGEPIEASVGDAEQPAASSSARDRGDTENAREERAYRRADEAGDPVGAFNLGVLLHRRGDLAGARAAYERAERRGDHDAGFNLGVLLYEVGDLDGAEAVWRRCIARGHPRAVANLQFLLQRRGASTDVRKTPPTEAAEGTYPRADQAGEPTGEFNLGVLLHQRGDLAGAQAAYERAERRGDPDAAFNLGVLLYETADLEGAEAAWRRSVARGHPQAAENLRFLQRRGGTGAREPAGVGGAPNPGERR